MEGMSLSQIGQQYEDRITATSSDRSLLHGVQFLGPVRVTDVPPCLLSVMSTTSFYNRLLSALCTTNGFSLF
eukprot:m.126575 g.126575  ORF g.126575 m.126575 type:complete len:72 (-) comp13835_c2_seq1:59-274(-)